MFKKIILVFCLIAMLSGVASSMATKAVVDAVYYGINDSAGIKIEPFCYVLVKDIGYLLEKAGIPVPDYYRGNMQKKPLYEKQFVCRIAAVLADKELKDENGESYLVKIPVMWFGGDSFIRSHYDGAFHYVAVVKNGENISVVEYDPLCKEEMVIKYSEPISNFTIFTSAGF